MSRKDSRTTVHESADTLVTQFGESCLPAELVARWDKQIATRYPDLSDEEQQSDQDQVRRYLPAVIEALTKAKDDI